MKGRNLFSSLAAGCVLAMVFVMVALAGGFAVSVEQPKASSDPLMKDAVLVVRTLGCNEPSEARLSAVAEGLVDGKRDSRTLLLREVDKGVYAVHRQWPSKGSWVLAITGLYNGHTSSALVELGANGSVITTTGNSGRAVLPVRHERRLFTEEEIELALASVARGDKHVATVSNR
jgi:hypothetical protein